MSFASDASTPVAKAGFAVVAGAALAAVLWWLVGTARQQPDFEPMPLVVPLLVVVGMAGLSVRRLAALDGKPWYATATAAASNGSPHVNAACQVGVVHRIPISRPTGTGHP